MYYYVNMFIEKEDGVSWDLFEDTGYELTDCKFYICLPFGTEAILTK